MPSLPSTLRYTSASAPIETAILSSVSSVRRSVFGGAGGAAALVPSTEADIVVVLIPRLPRVRAGLRGVKQTADAPADGPWRQLRRGRPGARLDPLRSAM